MRHILITITALLVAVPISATADFVSTSVDADEVSATRQARSGPATPAVNHVRTGDFTIARGLAYAGRTQGNDRSAGNATARPVAEPRTLLLLGLGLIAIGCVKRRK